ncbi:MAG TPA: T9SS type A sorting domain-containing protein [Ignavibacteriaceae bacterium]|nr:T9SS type A sorting domain-containing protein [Ignavibacteriaceae bacterium]
MKYSKSFRIIFFALIYLVLSKDNFPQADQLDSTFGQGGIVNTAFNLTSNCQPNSSAVQSDGKIIVAGSALALNNSDFAVARYDTNGMLDHTFGTNGIVLTKIGIHDSFIKSIAIQNDGKIVAAGYTGNGQDNDFALARYDQDGSLDSTFGENGIITNNIGSSDVASSVAVQTDGKIVFAGGTLVGTQSEIALFRYNPNGALDNTFGTNGVVLTKIDSSDADANSLVIQNDGKIVVAGYDTENDIFYDFMLARYNSNGAPDNTFGTNGIVITPIGLLSGIANSLSFQSDGKIVAAGNSGVSNFTLVRYNLNGTLDDSFGINGIVANKIGDNGANIFSVSIGIDEKIIAAGYSRTGSNSDFTIARYNSNGAFDNTFGTNGVVITPVGTSDNYATSVLSLPNGKIAAAGSLLNPDASYFVLNRYNINGDLDNTFGENGIVTTPIGYSFGLLSSIAVQNDGKIVAAGTSGIAGFFEFTAVRYNSNGTLDNTFGTNGIAVTQPGSADDLAQSVAVQSDGKIVVAGYSSNNGGFDNFTLIRYKQNGFPDDGFGINGIVITPIGTSGSEANSVAIQNDGKIIAGGFSDNGVVEVFTLTRYNSDGTLDDQFGPGGIASTRILSSFFSYVNSILIQGDGKIIAAGFSRIGNDDEFAVVRYNPTGTLDTAFGEGGIVTTALGIEDRINSISLQSDGKIVAGGISLNGGKYKLALARYNTDGALDSTFGTNGIVNTQVGSLSTSASSVLIRSDGKIIAAGLLNNNQTSFDPALLRYNADGTLDNTFGTNGVLISHIGNSNSAASSLAIQNDGKMIVGGYSETPDRNSSVFTLIRYSGDPATGITNQEKTKIPELYMLSQNYPNPFNPSTTIRYALPKESFVTLKIYDILGREVETLVNKENPAGTYEVRWNAGGFSTGVYFYQVKAGSFVETRKMILIK